MFTGIRSLRLILLALLLTLSGIDFIFATDRVITSCEHEIVFLPQSHAIDQEFFDFDVSYTEIDSVVASQLRTGHYIEDNKGVAVFSEQVVANDLDIAYLNFEDLNELKQKYTKLFPTGLPQDISELSDLQKREIHDNGAEFMEMIFGNLDKIYRVTPDQKTLDDLMKPIIAWYKGGLLEGKETPLAIEFLKYGKRERLALEQVNKYFANYPEKRRVILMFGAKHSFSFYPDLFPPECVYVPQSFMPYWSGKNRVGPYGFK